MKKPDYGDATPEDLLRALMNVPQKKGRYRRSGARYRQALPRQTPNNRLHLSQSVKIAEDCASPQTPSRSDQDA